MDIRQTGRNSLGRGIVRVRKVLLRPRALSGEARAKLAVCIAAATMGVAIFIGLIYGLIPAVLTGISEQMEKDDAKSMYRRTILSETQSPSVEQVFEQPEAAVRFPRDSFAAVLRDNPDIVGRISIDALDINYLVVQSTDNAYYLDHGYGRTKSKSGAIFLDYRCNADAEPLVGHYILYGHNMKNGSMFHNLLSYKDEDFFEENRLIRFDTVYEDYSWEVFSAYVTGTDFYYIDTSFKDDAEWLAFLQEIKAKSLYDTDIRLDADDVVLTLSTCDYTFDDARFVVHARLVQ